MKPVLWTAVAMAALILVGAALADPLDPRVRQTKADVARAAAVLLVKADLGPGWRGGRSASQPSLKAPVCPALRPDYSHLTITGHAESVFDNGNGGFQVVSDVEVWKSVKQARTHMNAFLQPSLPKCIKNAILKGSGGASLTLLPVQRLKIQQLTDVTAHYRAPVGYKAGGKTLIIFSDLVFMRQGRTEIYLNVIAPSTDKAQLKAFETRIVRKLAQRVRA